MHNLDNNELATIRIAMLGKIDDICKYIRDCEKYNNESGKMFWKDSYEVHTKLLNKLYDHDLLNRS